MSQNLSLFSSCCFWKYYCLHKNKRILHRVIARRYDDEYVNYRRYHYLTKYFINTWRSLAWNRIHFWLKDHFIWKYCQIIFFCSNRLNYINYIKINSVCRDYIRPSNSSPWIKLSIFKIILKFAFAVPRLWERRLSYWQSSAMWYPPSSSETHY